MDGPVCWPDDADEVIRGDLTAEHLEQLAAERAGAGTAG